MKNKQTDPDKDIRKAAVWAIIKEILGTDYTNTQIHNTIWAHMHECGMSGQELRDYVLNLIQKGSIRKTFGDADGRPPPELGATAVLIAAAPEMNALLRQLEWSGVGSPGGGDSRCPVCHSARSKHPLGSDLVGHKVGPLKCKLGALLARIDDAKAKDSP